jgi:hypothetical protein
VQGIGILMVAFAVGMLLPAAGVAVAGAGVLAFGLAMERGR